MTVLSAPRSRRHSFGQLAAVWLALSLGSWAALAAVAFLVYIGLLKVWP